MVRFADGVLPRILTLYVVLVVVAFVSASHNGVNPDYFASVFTRLKASFRQTNAHNLEADRVDPEVFMNATRLITSKGYPCENHYVTTEDGFVLNMQRIPHGRERQPQGNQPVVFLQHGLLGSSTNFLTNLANESLAYILADAGADVWLGNMRGDTYSRNHTHLNPNDDKFWQWSFDEMAKFDLPAMVDYVVQQTGGAPLYYVGHSQGTLTAFIGFGTDQALASKVKLFIALAPVAKVGHIKSPIRLLAPFARKLEVFLDIFGHGEFLPNDGIMKFLAEQVCPDIDKNLLCENILFLFGGFDSKSLNRTRIPVYVSHSPAGTSVQNILHFSQGVNTDKFQKFDYGSAEKNMEHYGQPTPPQYNLSTVTTPVAIFRGGQDWLADPEDVAWLVPQLKNVVLNFEIDHWEHLDFIWAVDSYQACYKHILDLIFKK